MKKRELDRIIRRHRHWLNRDCKDWEKMRADLSGADLSGIDLHGVNLHGVNLRRANLSGVNMSRAKLSGAVLSGANLLCAKLSGADLSYTDLSYTDLRQAVLTGVNLSGANLYKANLPDSVLSGADLSGAELSYANLSKADLSRADLSGAKLSWASLSYARLSEAKLSETDFEYADIYTAIFDKKEKHRKGIVLAKPIKGYKKTAEGVIITAEIPAGAVVFSINGKKCRTNIATITDMAGHKLLHSMFIPSFTYKKGQKILITNFDTPYNIECGAGFHFFRTKKDAKDY